jgi:TolA-binding protein
MNEEDVIRNKVGAIRHIKLEENTGKLRVDIVDDRFLLSSFRYIIDSTFNDLEDAVEANENIKNKLASEYAFGGGSSDRYFRELNDIINPDAETPDSMQVKIASLESRIKQLQSLLKTSAEYQAVQADELESIRTDLFRKIAQLSKLGQLGGAESTDAVVDSTVTDETITQTTGSGESDLPSNPNNRQFS